MPRLEPSRLGEFMAAAIDRKIFFREELCLQAGRFLFF